MKSLFSFLVCIVFAATAGGATLTKEQTCEVFFLLGMTDEYNGHAIGKASRFLGGRPAAKAIYMRHAEALRLSLGLERVEDVWAVVDSFYRPPGLKSEGRLGVANEQMFEGNSGFKMHYIRGAITRFWDAEKKGIRLVNAGSKAHLLVELLTIFGDKENIEVRLSVVPAIPTSYLVSVVGSKRFDELVAEALSETP
jgi:hypothetical protein